MTMTMEKLKKLSDEKFAEFILKDLEYYGSSFFYNYTIENKEFKQCTQLPTRQIVDELIDMGVIEEDPGEHLGKYFYKYANEIIKRVVIRSRYMSEKKIEQDIKCDRRSEEMTTMNEIKKMTRQELAEYMTEKCYYTGVTEGFYFQPVIEGHTVGYTLEVDNKGIIQKALELGHLKDEEVGDLDELSEDEILELAEVYYEYEEEIDKSLVETMRDEIIEALEENLQEVKDEE